MTRGPLYTSTSGHPFSEAAWLDLHFEACRTEYESAFRAVELLPGWHVLDAGCGSGSFVPWIAEVAGEKGRVTALDLDPTNVATVRRRTAEQWEAPCPITTVAGTVTALPFPDDHLDAIWCANTTQYLPDDDLRVALREFRRAVRPGGLIAIKEVDPHHCVLQPAVHGLFRRHFETALDLPGFNPVKGLFRVWNLPALLAEAGIEPLYHQTSIIERRAPLRPVERSYLTHYLAVTASIVFTVKSDLLPESDLAAWRELQYLDSEDHIVDHPNFYWCEGQAVSVGRVPSD